MIPLVVRHRKRTHAGGEVLQSPLRKKGEEIYLAAFFSSRKNSREV